ncbi:hypothetical protein D3P07_20720 [Paenibacillus sp. 1011MAR3C5]|uniref:Ig-like domain-containing protein n=1 Tax=Paenibacillus sp. 1011MAR3C5 TaxID=1675787 RepID=UPI000E6BBDE5|nr:Ig-like domain-containing protein [Paenibacillus sp. 1011MAR3C5]RJE85621.1 hypothetical protein D3P07_20720 [Paenibacillus sp. 1011MAR3C5]
MYRMRKLSLLLSIAMLLQFALPGWSSSETVTAAPGGPIVTSFFPAKNLDNVPLRTSLRLTFDENVKLGASSTSIYIYKTENNTLVETIGATSGRVSISGNQATITPSLSSIGGRFELNTEYYVLIDQGAFVNDSNGASYLGVQDATTWRFRTVIVEDNTKPQYTYRSPEGDNASITSPITISFSKPVYAASGDIVLESTEDNRYIPVTSSSVTGSGTSYITITPDGALMPKTTYRVRISGSNFQDSSGNTFAGMTWTFTTGTAPVNLASSNPFVPAKNATLVPTTGAELIIRFDQQIQANTNKYIEIRRVSDNVAAQRILATSSSVKVDFNSVTIKPNTLAPNTPYYVWIEPGAFSRPSPNASQWFYGISSATVWNFTTGYGNDTTPPNVTTYSPTRGGTLTSLNGKLTLTFNKEVYLNSGDIEIRHANSGTIFRSIPITSTRVKGAGTKELTIDATSHVSSSDAAKSFVNNTRYYVTIGSRAIRDGAGNFFPGISGSSGWSFMATQDDKKPNIVSLTPANNSSVVEINDTFRATFDKPIMVSSNSSKQIKFITKVQEGYRTIVATYSIDPEDNKSIIINPGRFALSLDTRYFVNIDEGAVTDLAGNEFAGILNEYQWTFLTRGADTTPPSISRTEVSGSTIRLIYNEPLKESLKPSAASFYVTVAGLPRNVTAVKIEGNIVFVSLASNVSANQKVTLSYTKPGNPQIRDLSDNAADTLNNVDISNGASNTSPVISSATASGTTVTLRFSEELMKPHAYAYSQFTITVGGVNYSANTLTQNGNTITLNLFSSIPSGQQVHISYSPISYPLIGISGNHVTSFSNYLANSGSSGGGGTGGTTGAPQIQSVSASGNMVSIRYNRSLNTTSTPGAFQFSVQADSQTKSITNITLSGDSVILTLSSTISNPSTMRVSYYGSSSTTKDIYGNAAASFNSLSITSGTGGGSTGSISMIGAILKGNQLTISFSETLDPSYVPSNSFFVVRVKDLVRLVTGVKVEGSTVILTLDTAAKVGEKTEVTYLSNSNGLRSISGNTVNVFNNANVANQTTILDSLTGDYEAADGGGVGILPSASSITNDTSPAGVSANRYTLVSEKFIAAVTTSRDAGLTSPRIVFKVPDYENAALVAVPIVALEMANRQGGDVTFVVQHGDATFELPLKTLNFTELSRALNGSGSTNHLLMAIDKGNSSKTQALTTALNSSSASIIAGPLNFEIWVVNGSNKQEVTNYSGYVSRTLKTSASVNESQSAVVWLDSITGTLSYVPTTFKQEGGSTKATFKRKGNSAYALVRNTKSFSDMGKHWSSDTVQMMARKFIVEGRTATAYEPDKPITRGEFATYIAKGLGLAGNRAAVAKFKDVNADTVMGAYIGAAASAGIVNGTSSTAFKPNNFITRQEMAAMMMRAAKVAGMSVSLPSSADSYLQKYTDRSKVSAYAKTNMAEAVYLGIINGKTNTTLSPATNASRAEGAVMIMRLLEKAEFLSQ